MGTPHAQMVVSKYLSQLKETGCLVEMAASEAGVGGMQDEPGALILRKQEVLRERRGPV